MSLSHSIAQLLTWFLGSRIMELTIEYLGWWPLGPVSRSPCALLKLDFLTNAMHLLYALVRKSSFSKAQGFVKPAPAYLLIVAF